MKRILLFLGLIVLFTSTVNAACPLTVSTPLQTVRLIDDSDVFIVDKDNKEHAVTSQKNIPLYSDTGEVRAGSMTFIPNTDETEGSFIVHINGTEPFSFTPTIFDLDWGYGVRADHGALERKGDYIKIAIKENENKWHAVWVKRPESSLSLPFEPLTAVRVDGQGYIIRYIKDDVIHLVSEADVLAGSKDWESCERIFSGDTRYIDAVKKPDLLIPFHDIYDDSCQLRMTISYTRGC